MKYLLLIMLLPLFVSAQSRKQRKAQEKADKELVANLKMHVQNLLSLRETANESAVPEYISAQFKAAGLAPDSTGAYIKNFTAIEGKYINNNTNIFTVNDSPLALNEDYFPLAFSGNATAEGSASLSLREKGSPWFLDVKDMLDDDKNDNAFDISSAIKKQAAQVEERKASALIVYNSSNATDNIRFNKTDSTAALHVPVVYLNDVARKKFFKDATDFYDVKLTTELDSKQTSTQNIVGYINNNASATVIINTYFKHYTPYENADTAKNSVAEIAETANMLELARMIKKANLHNNNYLFVASPVRKKSFSGLAFLLEDADLHITPNYILEVCKTTLQPEAKTITISGAGSSEGWKSIIDDVNKNNQLSLNNTTGNEMQPLLQHKNIPALFVSIGAPQQATALNYDSEKDAVNFLARLIINTDAKGKLPFTVASVQP